MENKYGPLPTFGQDGGSGQQLIPTPTPNDIVTVDGTGQVIDSGRHFYDGVIDNTVSTDEIPNALNVYNAINSAVMGFIKIVGNYNAATNDPFLEADVGVEGTGYFVSVPGTQTLPFGTPTTCYENDIVYYPFGGGDWVVKRADSVRTVNGILPSDGNVALNFGDIIGIDLVGNTAENILKYDGVNWTNGQINLSSSNAVSNQLGLSNGGTGSNLTANNGGVIYSDATQLQILSGTAVANRMFQSGASSAPSWSTATYPATTTAGRLLYSSATNTVSELTTVASGALVATNTGVPAYTSALRNGEMAIGSTGNTPLRGNINCPNPNQITVTYNSPNIELTLPQAIGATSNVTFASVTATTFTGNATNATLASRAVNISGGLQYSIPYQTGANTTSFIASGSQYQSLVAGASGVPGWGAVNLAQASAVTGVLPNANTTANSAASANTLALRDANSALSATSFIVDTNFYSSILSSNSTQTWDSGDYNTFVRASNRWDWYIASAKSVSLSSQQLAVNGNGAVNGVLQAGGGSIEGGQLDLGYINNFDLSTAGARWTMDVITSNDLRIFRTNAALSSVTVMTVSESTGAVAFPAGAIASNLTNRTIIAGSVTMGDGTNNFTTSTASYSAVVIGNQVQLNLWVIWTSKGSATGNIRINLPYTVNAAWARTGASLSYRNGFNLSAVTGETLTAGVDGGSSQLMFFKAPSTGAALALTGPDCAASGEIQVSLFIVV